MPSPPKPILLPTVEVSKGNQKMIVNERDLEKFKKDGWQPAKAAPAPKPAPKEAPSAQGNKEG